MRKEHRLSVFKKRVMRGTPGPKRDEVTGDWRKQRNEELNNFCYSPNCIRVIKPRRMRDRA
jgi:hypothetical protein